MNLKVIKYTNACAIEASWLDDEGKETRVTAYSGDQVQLFRDDVTQYGGDISEWESLLTEIEAEWVPPPPPPVVIPQAVTMRQAHLALLQAGLLDQVDTAIASIPDATERKAAQIEWEYSNEVHRQSQWVNNLAGALGLDAEGLDALFTQAATL